MASLRALLVLVLSCVISPVGAGEEVARNGSAFVCLFSTFNENDELSWCSHFSVP